MSAALHLPRISTNVRFAASALLFPELSADLAERLFLTPPQPRDAALTALAELFLAGVIQAAEPDIVALQEVDVANDRGERRPKLMGNHAQEFILHPVGRAQLFFHRLAVRDIDTGRLRFKDPAIFIE